MEQRLTSLILDCEVDIITQKQLHDWLVTSLDSLKKSALKIEVSAIFLQQYLGHFQISNFGCSGDTIATRLLVHNAEVYILDINQEVKDMSFAFLNSLGQSQSCCVLQRFIVPVLKIFTVFLRLRGYLQ